MSVVALCADACCASLCGCCACRPDPAGCCFSCAGCCFSYALLLLHAQEVRAGLLGGPCIIVADEAHQMKNEKSSYCRSMRQLASRRRLALTGYPLQNNMNEYYQMILWVSGMGRGGGYCMARHGFFTGVIAAAIIQACHQSLSVTSAVYG